MSNSESQISMNEYLSALLDDEAGSFEEQRVLDSLKSDEILSQKLANYALIGETMRTSDTKQSVLTLGSSFLDGIHEKLNNEDQFDEVLVATSNESNQITAQGTAANSSSWLRPVGGFALAASVGALAFMGLQNIGVLNNPTINTNTIVDGSAPTAIANSETVNQTKSSNEASGDLTIATNDDQYVDADAQTRSMLKRYVDSHMQYAATSTFVPSVRVIAYTDNQ